MDAEILSFAFGSIILCYFSCLMLWVIVLTLSDKLNRQLNVGLAATTCSIQFFIVNGIVIACIS